MPIRTTHFFAPTAWLSIAAVLAALSGCNPSRPAQATKAAAESLNQPRESWEIYLLQGSRVGYGHTVARREVESGRDVLRTESVSHLALLAATTTSAGRKSAPPASKRPAAGSSASRTK